MWILAACASALFAGLTSILAKCGIQKTDSNVSTAIRTVVALLFSWLMVWIVGSQETIWLLSGKTWLFLILSGLSTGASWLCYFHALQIGEVNQVVVVDKSSSVLSILLALIFLHEGLTLFKAVSVALIGMGTFLMIEKKNTSEDFEKKGHAWLLYAALSAIFAALTSVFGKIGISGVESNLGTAIRTTVVLAMAWIVVFVTGKQRALQKIERKDLLFILLSGLATGASWLCYYRALQEGPASVVIQIDKLSLLVTVAFSYFVFREKLTRKGWMGLALIVTGTFMLVFAQFYA